MVVAVTVVVVVVPTIPVALVVLVVPVTLVGMVLANLPNPQLLDPKIQIPNPSVSLVEVVMMVVTPPRPPHLLTLKAETPILE